MKSLLFILLFLIFQSYTGQYDHLFSIIVIQCLNIIPIKPLKTYKDPYNSNLLKKDFASSLGGVYGLILVESSKQYIRSTLNLYSSGFILRVEILT